MEENKLLKPKCPRFAVNAQVKIWEGYNIQSIYASCLNALSNYFIQFDRNDIIPVSDIIALFENIDGIDSVNVWFDADVENQSIYSIRNFYGIDEYGDILLTRTYQDINGNTKNVRDILPIIRGGFTSPDGTSYSNVQSFDSLSAFNLTLIEYTQKRRLTLENYKPITQ